MASDLLTVSHEFFPISLRISLTRGIFLTIVNRANLPRFISFGFHGMSKGTKNVLGTTNNNSVKFHNRVDGIFSYEGIIYMHHTMYIVHTCM